MTRKEEREHLKREIDRRRRLVNARSDRAHRSLDREIKYGIEERNHARTVVR